MSMSTWYGEMLHHRAQGYSGVTGSHWRSAVSSMAPQQIHKTSSCTKHPPRCQITYRAHSQKLKRNENEKECYVTRRHKVTTPSTWKPPESCSVSNFEMTKFGNIVPAALGEDHPGNSTWQKGGATAITSTYVSDIICLNSQNKHFSRGQFIDRVQTWQDSNYKTP